MTSNRIMQDYKDCLIIMAKKPEPGRVMTRLAKNIGQKNAAEIYECFLYDLFSRLQKVSMPYMISCDKQESVSYFEKFSAHNIIVQIGDNLGDRMFFSLQDCFRKGISKVVLIGSDSPDVPLDYLQQAFKKLSSYDIVLGPSEDGGYYLIGCNNKSLHHKIFTNISWSTENVWDETMRNLEEIGLSHFILEKWYDIDDKVDLQRFYAANYESRDAYRAIQYLIGKGIFDLDRLTGE